MPAIAAAIMGAAAKGTYMGMQLFVSSNIICLVPSLLVAVIIYFVAALMIGAVGREQLLNLPKGQLIVRVAEKCHLLRR